MSKNRRDISGGGVETEVDAFFVVRNFKAFTSKWRLHSSSSPTEATAAKMEEATVAEHDTLAVRTDSNSILSEVGSVKKEEVVYDSTRDLAYHNSSEREGAKLVYRALTPEERSAMPDAFMPLRHYRAEKGHIAKAINSIKLTLRWRKEFQIDKIVAALEDDAKTTNDKPNGNEQNEDLATILRKESETGKMYVRGYDKDGRALIYMRPSNENTNHEDNNMIYLVHQLEKAIACSQKNEQGKICLVIDYDGMKLSQVPSVSSSKKTLNILQCHYCERMYRVYICNPPLVFKTMYAMVKPFVDPVTRQKLCWCVGKDGSDQMMDDVGGPEKAAVQLEKCCGSSETVRDFDSAEYSRLPLTLAFDENINY